jgi:hypothetical protein
MSRSWRGKAAADLGSDAQTRRSAVHFPEHWAVGEFQVEAAWRRKTAASLRPLIFLADLHLDRPAFVDPPGYEDGRIGTTGILH